MVAAMTLPNVLDRLREGMLVVTPGDRPEIVLGVLFAHVSPDFPQISAIVLNGGLGLPDQVTRLIEGLEVSTPIITTELGTHATVSAMTNRRGRLSMDSPRKVGTAMKLFAEHVDGAGPAGPAGGGPVRGGDPADVRAPAHRPRGGDPQAHRAPRGRGRAHPAGRRHPAAPRCRGPDPARRPGGGDPQGRRGGRRHHPGADPQPLRRAAGRGVRARLPRTPQAPRRRARRGAADRHRRLLLRHHDGRARARPTAWCPGPRTPPRTRSARPWRS